MIPERTVTTIAGKQVTITTYRNEAQIDGLTTAWSYDANSRLTQARNATASTISQYDYTYDTAGRRVSRAKSGAAMSESRSGIYGYNARSELISSRRAAESAEEYAYSYDPIGNRQSSADFGTNRTYTANNLNQYTEISTLRAPASPRETFIPQFDDDGNQTVIETKTGVWTILYNGENRSTLWTSGSTNIVMSFDRMGRRVSYTETVGVTTNAHRTFVYDNYLQIANNAGNRYVWDPTEPVATRPLVWIHNADTYSYTHDGNKNVSEVVDGSGIAVAHYEYAPFGEVTVAAGSLASANRFRFSSEYADDALGLVYYNYRHYEPVTGRWMARDPVEDYDNSYAIVNTLNVTDTLGLYRFIDRSCDCYKTDIDNAFSSIHKALSTIPKYETKKKQSGKPKTKLDELVETIRGYYSELGIKPINTKFTTSQTLSNSLEDFKDRATSGRAVPSLDCCPDKSVLTHPCNRLEGSNTAAAVTEGDQIHICCEGFNNSATYGGLDCIIMHEMLHKIIHSTHEQMMTGENLQNERLVVRISTLFMGKQCPVPAYSETGQ